MDLQAYLQQAVERIQHWESGWGAYEQHPSLAVEDDHGPVEPDERYRADVAFLGSGGRGNKFYASMVLVGDQFFATSRKSGTFVIAAKPTYEKIAQNKIAGDESDFNGTPAVSSGQLFLRSNKFLYCISK